MNRNIDRQQAFQIAAEKMRLKREKEEREEKEFYERITSGTQWLLFKIVVVFCTLMVVISTIETFLDGPTKKLSDQDWKINKTWEWTWHKILDVEGYMFSPTIGDWSERVDGTLELTYTPIFHGGKKLSFDSKINENTVIRHEEFRQRSIFTWFPVFQILLLIPLFTFLFKQQKPWFNFARIFSFVFILPGTLMIIVYAMM